MNSKSTTSQSVQNPQNEQKKSQPDDSTFKIDNFLTLLDPLKTQMQLIYGLNIYPKDKFSTHKLHLNNGYRHEVASELKGVLDENQYEVEKSIDSFFQKNFSNMISFEVMEVQELPSHFQYIIQLVQTRFHEDISIQELKRIEQEMKIEKLDFSFVMAAKNNNQGDAELLILDSINDQKAALLFAVEKYNQKAHLLVEQQTSDRSIAKYQKFDKLKVLLLQTNTTVFTDLSVVSRFHSNKANSELISEILEPTQNKKKPTDEEQIELNQIRNRIEKLNINNKNQEQAILRAIDKQDIIRLIQGPPGTGKTETECQIVQIMFQIMKENYKQNQLKSHQILITSQTNFVINQLRKKLSKIDDLTVLRLGVLDKIEDDDEETLLSSLEYISELILFEEFAGNNQQVLEFIIQFQESFQTPRFTLWDLKKEIFKNHKKGLFKMYFMVEEFLREHRNEKKKIMKKLLIDANVIIGTNYSTNNLQRYMDDLDLHFEFELTIIDQAPQSSELSTLIPLNIPTKQVVLIGDPEQLLPYTKDFESQREFRYNNSLFKRLSNTKRVKSTFLNINFRSMPQFVAFTNYFYQNEIRSDNKIKYPEQFKTFLPKTKNHLLIDLETSRMHSDLSNRGSLTNMVQADAIVAALKYFIPHMKSIQKQGYESPRLLVVITPYKEQVNLINEQVRSAFSSELLKNPNYLDSSIYQAVTIDSYQGCEADIVLISLVRTMYFENGVQAYNAGFITQHGRFNVLTSRARYAQICFSQLDFIYENQFFDDFIYQMEQKNSIVSFKNQVTMKDMEKLFNQL